MKKRTESLPKKSRSQSAAEAGCIYRFDAQIRARGYRFVAGIDEAGRGPLAGPVVAAAVMLPENERFDGLTDSKLVPPEQRDTLYDLILEKAFCVGIGVAGPEEIDRINILQATLQAASTALKQLDPAPDYLVTDYLKLPDPPCGIEPLVKGDARSASIAAASIIAKVTRDRLMLEYDPEYPGYEFASHKGYGCPKHWEALQELGPTTIHRLSFSGVCFFDEPCRHSMTFQRLTDRIERASCAAELTRLQSEMNKRRSFLPTAESRQLETAVENRLSCLER